MNEPEKDMDGSAMPFGGNDDAWLESLLRADRSAQHHIDDAGFSASVMAALPPRAAVRKAPAWLVPAMTAAGCALAATLTPAGENLVGGLNQLFNPMNLWRFHASSLLALVPLAVVVFSSFAAVRDS
jgi:hypothetical protein